MHAHGAGVMRRAHAVQRLGADDVDVAGLSQLGNVLGRLHLLCLGRELLEVEPGGLELAELDLDPGLA